MFRSLVLKEFCHVYLINFTVLFFIETTILKALSIIKNMILFNSRSVKTCNDKTVIPTFFLKACLPVKNGDIFQYLIKWTNTGFSTILASASRITKIKTTILDINLRKYRYEAMSTLLYIENKFLYKFRKNPSLFKFCQFKSNVI